MTAAGNAAPALAATDDAAGPNSIDSSAMDGSSSSKVTVEYHDPFGLFPLIQNQLEARLPLRNLHWKSPNRPLRSIDSLHVDLVASKDGFVAANPVGAGLAPPEGGVGAGSVQRKSGPTSSEILRPPAKERRHQIPGLRQTPYLKVYLLRCDDSDTYKATARKQLREWVKTHTPPSQSSSSSSTQENHDAYEWMIIHVVLPDTPAAAQPRSSTASNTGAGSTEKASAGSRWTRGTSTLLEKIRADFNISSKSAPDRVAQVRLHRDAVPPHLLPGGAGVVPPSINETAQEQDFAWTDTITKFKTLILLSFDLRVRQYEEDIREKDSQRALPGWNFCTFFILKEGLARGFESVGLVEDALVGYDELSIGLDSIVRDQANEGSQAQGGSILSYSADLHQRAVEIMNQAPEDGGTTKQTAFHDEHPINANKKNYRDLILSNNISVFDFRSYIFARQMSLFLRLGNSYSARTDLSSKHRSSTGKGQRSQDDGNRGTRAGGRLNESEDLLSLAELCSRALHFITSAARLLREDLLNGAKSHNVSFPDRLVDNLTSSWTFAAAQQILDETATASLPVSTYLKEIETASSGKVRPFGGHNVEPKLSLAEQKTNLHPARSSSLSYGRSHSNDPPYARAGASGQVVYDHGQYQERPPPNQEGFVQTPLKTGLQELAGNRAQLYTLERRVLEHIGDASGWRIGWAAIGAARHPQQDDLSEVDLNDGGNDDKAISAEKPSPSVTPTVGLSVPVLAHAASSIDKFREVYESISDLIVKHYMAAGQIKSGESILGDLAALRFELGDYAAAAAYFGRMASLFAESRWNMVETTMLRMYAQCLKKLNRKDEYVRTLLDLLAKSASKHKSIRTTSKGAAEKDAIRYWIDDDEVDTTGMFQELVAFSEQLPYDVSVPMAKYFGDIQVEPYIRHFDDRDGFQLRLQFRHLLKDEIQIKQAKVRLINATSGQGKEIWLENNNHFALRSGMSRIWLVSNVNTTGPYIVDRIAIAAKRIVFVHEPFAKAEAATPLTLTTSVSAASLRAAKKSRILCFPRTEAFQARIFHSHFIHIDKPRSMEIECSSGANDIRHAQIRVRSASAGLRLRTADASVDAGEVKIAGKPSPGVIDLEEMAPDTVSRFCLPYELETAHRELSIKLEVEYTTDHGHFQYFSAFSIPIDLPLDVNVHDHFKKEALFSKFNIKTANTIPLEILDVNLEGNDDFDVESPTQFRGPLHVLHKQPVAVTYKITKKPAPGSDSRRMSRISNTSSLALSVEYRCKNEDVLERLKEMFSEAIASSPLHRLRHLLVHSFADRVEHRILPPQFERSVLLDRVRLGSFEEMAWGECLESLPETLRDDTRKWLQKWHEDHESISLATPSDPKSPIPGAAPPSPNPPRRIIITVTIPATHIVHTASLSLASPSQPSSHSSPIAIMGQPLTAHLRLSHTRRWATPSSLASAAHLSSPDDAMEFVYTVEANPEIWLVAGQKRGHYVAKEDELHEVPIMLLPLRPGNFLLPAVDIQVRVKDKDKAGDHDRGGGRREQEEGAEQLNCETDYLSYGECVMVVPDVKASTVGIGEMGTGRQGVWLESM